MSTWRESIGVTTFLFWNFKNKDQEATAARTALFHKVDVLVLAESRIRPDVMLRELNARTTDYHYPRNLNEKFAIFTRFPGDFLEPFEDHPRLTVRRLRLPGKTEILFAAIHFFDRRNYTEGDQYALSRHVSDVLRGAERRAGNEKTVLVGDFNMNPFDQGMIDPDGFGAMMTRELVRKRSQTQGRIRTLFYNPMWGRLGDTTVGPAGTFYHSKLTPTNVYWHTLDQVLIRPGLLDAFQADQLQVLTRAQSAKGEIELVSDGPSHWNVKVSDHLPILFRLDLTKGSPDA